MVSRNKIRYGIFITIVALGASAYAHGKATGIVRERMELMSSIADAMKTLGGMVKGGVSFDATLAQKAAAEISVHASKMAPLFPADNANMHSEALPTIWENWDEFEQIARDLEAKATVLSTAASTASTGADLQAEFLAVGKSCGTCHEKFRLKK